MVAQLRVQAHKSSRILGPKRFPHLRGAGPQLHVKQLDGKVWTQRDRCRRDLQKDHIK